MNEAFSRSSVCITSLILVGLSNAVHFSGVMRRSLFERFAREVAAAVGDLSRFWVTFNEPNVYAACGYVFGEFPPGRKGELFNALRVNSIQAQLHVLAYSRYS